MSTQPQPIQRRETVEFEINVPVECALKYAGSGKIVNGRFGDRVMYTLADDRVMFLDLGVAQQINELNLNVREKFFVCRKQNRQTRKAEWAVWLSPDSERARAANEMAKMDAIERSQQPLEKQLQASLDIRNLGEQSDGTFAVPNMENRPGATGSHSAAPASTVPTKGTSTSNSDKANTALVDEANSLVDAYAQVLERALTKYQGRIKPDEVKGIVLSAYIQRGKAGSYAG